MALFPAPINTRFDMSGPIEPIEIRQYPDGMPMVKMPIPLMRAMLVRYTSLNEVVAALMLARAERERRTRDPLHLILPFLPGARQDRKNRQGDFLFTAKYVAGLINDCKFDSVTCIDPHSDVMPGMIDRCRSASIFWGLVKGKWDAVVAPDAGAVKRAQAAADKLEIPVLQAWKNRDVGTGKISGFGIQDPGSLKHLLVVDDICDGGGTFVGLGEVLKEKGCTSDLFVSHGVFSGNMAPLHRLYGRIICTDSMLTPAPHGVEVIEMCEELLRGFY